MRSIAARFSAVARRGQLDLRGSLHRAGEHQGVIGIDHVGAQAVAKSQIIKPYAAALEAELGKRAAQRRIHVEGVVIACGA